MTEAESFAPSGTRRDFLIFAGIVTAAAVVLWFATSDVRQTAAGSVFIATVVGTLMFWRFRLAVAFFGIAALLATQSLDIAHMIRFMNLDVITFLVAMMIIVDIAKDSGFFSWLLGRLLKVAYYDPKKVLVILLVVSTLMAALVDEVTSILFMIAIVFEYCSYFELDPLPYVISTVLATNVGSSATMLGNPVGLLIGLRGNLTFEDFLVWATPVAVLSLLILVVILPIWYRRSLEQARVKVAAKLNGATTLHVFDQVDPRKIRDVKISGALLFGTILLVAVHYRLELLFGVEKFTYLLVAAFTGAAIGLTWKREKAREIVDKGVDWWTLVFFMFLFAKAGALKYTGLTDRMASGIASVASSQFQIQTFILWFSAAASSLLDNVVLVAALIPVVQSLSGIGFNGAPLWWGLLFGGVYGGNITMIGSTANIVALGMMEKKFNYHMKFFKWLWVGLVGGLLPTLVAQVWLTTFFH